MDNKLDSWGSVLFCLLVLLPVSHLFSYALANIVLVILTIHTFRLIIEDSSRITDIFKSEAQLPAKMLLILLAWVLFVVVKSIVSPPISTVSYRFTLWFHKPIRSLLIAWILLRTLQRISTVKLVYRILGATCFLGFLALYQYPLTQIGTIRMLPRFPSGRIILGISELSCVAAFLAVCMLTLSIYSNSSKLYRLLFILGSVIAVTIVLATGSRSAAASVLTGSSFLLAESLYRRAQHKMKSMIVPLIVGIVAICTLSGAFLALNPRYLKVNDLKISGGFRLIAWREGIRCGLKHPLTGFGAIELKNVYRAYGPSKGPPPHDVIDPNEAHCDYITWFMKAGIIGLATYLAFWVCTIWHLTKASRLVDGIDGILIFAITAGSVSSLTYGCTSSFWWNNKSAPFVLFLVGVALAMTSQCESPKRSPV